MPPGRADLTIYQGDDFEVLVKFAVQVDPAPAPPEPMDLTGFTFVAQVRQTTADDDEANNTDKLAEMVCAVTDAVGGEVNVSLDHVGTAALPITTARWDMQGVDGGGKVTTFLVGSVAVTAEVTRPGLD